LLTAFSNLLQQTGNKQCGRNLLTACEQTCNNLFADLLQLVRFYVCSITYLGSTIKTKWRPHFSKFILLIHLTHGRIRRPRQIVRLIRNRERMLQLFFYSKSVFIKYVDANDLLKTFPSSNFKKFILTLERYYLAII
jgi:hypothetical protein